MVLAFELAHLMGITAVAEGIETVRQLAFLRDVHCDPIQGYFYSKPLLVSTFEEWAAGQGTAVP